jgi:type II restriction enzyme
MNLRMDIGRAQGFKSKSQITRVVSESWANSNLYCPVCASNELEQAPNNTRAFDFVCPQCVARFQLKSCRQWDGRRIPDAGYHAMMNAILTDRNPNLVLLHYDDDWAVRNLLIVPSFFLSESAIEKRKPLAATARRAGWIGCNILLSSIPSVGKIAVIADGKEIERDEVRGKYLRAKPFASIGAAVRGWTVDVFKIVEMLPSMFTLSDVYKYEEQFADLHPRNRNVRPKIRQQLQVLRDMGMIRFLGGGRYERI